VIVSEANVFTFSGPDLRFKPAAQRVDTSCYQIVIAGLDPAIYSGTSPDRVRNEMAGSSPAMTVLKRKQSTCWATGIIPNAGPDSAVYGFLPPSFFRAVRDRFPVSDGARKAGLVLRPE